MFKKILIANRGEIAVRIARTCREMGIATIALYEAADETSLHIRSADECVLLQTPRGFNDADAILEIARAKDADAIHPGYGFLAESAEFVRACAAVGIAFIGPPRHVIERALAKIETLGIARDAGFSTVQNSASCAAEDDLDALRADAERLGYPVVVKSCRGGRGRGERVVRSPDALAEAVRRAQAESNTIYGDRHVFIEKVISPACQVGVQILADESGNLLHLGEHEGSLLHGNQKVMEESPAPCLNETQRTKLWQTALDLARLLRVRNAVTLEFLIDAQGQAYFTEVKPRLQVEHPLTEMCTRVDVVREQIRLAAGEPLGLAQTDVHFDGWAIMCRINAQDPQQNFMPSPGRVRVRFPNGPETRMDTYVYSGCVVPGMYDPLVAKLTVWAPDRARAAARLRRALYEVSFQGIATDVSWLRQWVTHPDFVRGSYSTETRLPPRTEPEDSSLRDLAVAAALYYARANDMTRPVTPERLATNWHRAARQLPE